MGSSGLLKELAFEKAKLVTAHHRYATGNDKKKKFFSQDYIDAIIYNCSMAKTAYDYWSGTELDMPRVFLAVIATSLKGDSYVSNFMEREFTHPEQIRSVNTYLELIVLFYAVRFGKEKAQRFFGARQFEHLRGTEYGVDKGLRLYDEVRVESLLRKFVE